MTFGIYFFREPLALDKHTLMLLFIGIIRGSNMINSPHEMGDIVISLEYYTVFSGSFGKGMQGQGALPPCNSACASQ